MTTTEDIVDAEIVDTPPRPASTTLAPRVRAHLVATRIQPAVHAVVSRRERIWAVLTFLAEAVTLDQLRGIKAWHRHFIVDYVNLEKIARREERFGRSTMSGDDWLEARRKRICFLILLGVVISPLAGLAAWHWAPPSWLRIAAGVLMFALFVSGHPWRKPADAPADERPPGWDNTIGSVRQAFIGAKLAKPATKTTKGTSVWFAPGTQPERVGEGIQLHLDLDSGITWRHVLAKREEVASGLSVDGDYMVVEKGKHSGQTKLWFAEDDPYRHGDIRTPLMDVERWDSWKAAPFGRTPHGFEVPLTLMYSNLLLGGSPGSGKGWTARVVATPFVLDPEARLFIANGKSSGDWKPLQNICGDHYVMGTTEKAMQRVSDMLDVLIEEMLRRNTYTEEHGVSKLVPQDGFTPWLAIFDEVHKHTGCSLPSEVKRGRKVLTWGEVVTEKLTTLVKEARSSGIVMVLLTQKPGAKSIPTDLRDPIGTRFACRVGNGTTSEQVLGKTTSEGVDASKLPAKHSGIGILVPDAEVAADITGYPTLRPYTIDDPDWKQLCERGYALRREAGTHGYLRLREEDALPLPPLLQAIVDEVADLPGDARVPSRELREKFAADMTETAFGLRLGKFGCPPGRNPGNQGPRGPLVGDVRTAAQRIREGGPVELLKSA